MEYEKPRVVDLGDLREITQGAGQAAIADRVRSTIEACAGDGAVVSAVAPAQHCIRPRAPRRRVPHE